jgi:glutamyl-tRNA reductase
LYLHTLRMESFGIIAFTHAGIGLDSLSHFHVEQESVAAKMHELKVLLDLEEIMYLSTCNRVEFIMVSEGEFDSAWVIKLVRFFQADWDKARCQMVAKKAKHWQGINAMNHLIEVACSLDSMVLGEREIITQVRNAHEFSRSNQLSGDTIRIAIKHTIETAKKVYTETFIAQKSVSVVALAYKQFAAQNISKDAKILVVGAGVTNQNLCRFLGENGYKNLTVFNRTFDKAKILAEKYGGVAHPLNELAEYTEGFDVLVSCTGANKAIVTAEIFTKLNLGDTHKKCVIDLAVPQDVDENAVEAFDMNYISVQSLQNIASEHLQTRRKELLKVRQIIFNALEEFKHLFEMRKVELKIRHIPIKVKEIRSTAMNEVFSKEIDQLDANSRETLDKILDYMEKKYVSVPMLMAKELVVKSTKS